MSKVLLVTGSIRPKSVNSKIVEQTKELLEKSGAEVNVANLGELALPFFDNENMPASPDFTESNESVVAWTKMVDEADGVILVTPEYNHTMSAIQKNALDWVYKEWDSKPVALVGYGWGGAEQAHSTARVVLGNIKASVLDEATNLYFTKDLNVDGSSIDESDVNGKIQSTVDALLAKLK